MCAWLDAHVNLESLGVPNGRVAARRAPDARAHGGAARRCSARRELEYPVIHVTGTNGKTSVVRIATALLVAQGVSDRRVRQPAPGTGERADHVGRGGDHRRDLAELLALIARRSSRTCPPPPSYFEILTGAAFRWFADVAVEAAVVEVGLGGRWDATNIVAGRGRGRDQRADRPRRVPR